MNNRYLALLRGINVGGNNIIKMAELKILFEGIGFTQIRTYIQSGNVVFSSVENNKAKIKNDIENALLKKTESNIKVTLLTKNEMNDVITNKPAGFGEDKEVYKYDVIYLMDALTSKDAIKEFSIREGVDSVYAGDKVLYFSILKSSASKSHISRIVESEIYPLITIRNWNTTEKLNKLLMELGDSK